VYVAEGTGT